MQEMTIAELIAEIRRGSTVTLMLRHAERPKMDPDDPTFGDALELTYEGTRSAKTLGKMLREFAAETQFYSSPLTRTRMTAECIAAGMGIAAPEIPTDELLGNGSFYYDDPAEVLEVFKPKNFFPACLEYFRTAHQRGFRELYAATDEFERWLDAHRRRRLFIVTTHDLYIAAFLYARQVGEFTPENWTRFLDGGAVIDPPGGGPRRFALVRTGLSDGIVGVRRPKISAVVFDFGGVMTMTTMPERVREYVGRFGIDFRALETGFARYRRLLDGGFITMAEMYDLIWADADIELSPAVRAQILEEDFASFLEGYRNERTLAWMRSLKAAGYRIGVLTNMAPELEERFRRVFADFLALADAVVVSGAERMFKPQRRIYELMRERLALPAEEICFIDDSPANCDGARRGHWHAVEFEDNAQVERDFGRLVGSA